MDTERIRDLVEEERSKLLDGRDNIADAVALRPESGTEVAIGLLALDQVDEAIDWFGAASREWNASAEATFTAKYVDSDDDHASMQPWQQYQRSLQTGILGHIDTSAVAQECLDRATEDFVSDLIGREKQLRIDLVSALGRMVLHNETDVDQLRILTEEHGDSYDQAYYLPQASVIEGIIEDDRMVVEDGLSALVDFHGEFVIDSPDTNVIDEAVAFDACAYLALARQHGLNVRVDSKYIPEGLTDHEYYPVTD